jgi:hypothetical protein
MEMSGHLGVIHNEAMQHGQWNRESVRDLGVALTELASNCMILREPSEPCRDSALRLMEGIANILVTDEQFVDDSKIDKQMMDIGQPLADLQMCIVDHYAISSDIGMGGDKLYTQWPGDDEGWLTIMEPNRINGAH